MRAFSKDLAEALRQGYARPGYQGAMQIWFEKLQQKKSDGHPIILCIMSSGSAPAIKERCHDRLRFLNKSDYQTPGVYRIRHSFSGRF
ncbi:MAG TPA: hypothetical protein DCK99_17785 [Blastocatellia bacterium]|nr:hypothetical protein [Blastocatellia bacterium]